MKTKKGTKIKESDHHTMITRFETEVNKRLKSETKEEIYNLKDAEGLSKFKEMTEGSFLSEVFDDPDKRIWEPNSLSKINE